MAHFNFDDNIGDPTDHSSETKLEETKATHQTLQIFPEELKPK